MNLYKLLLKIKLSQRNIVLSSDCDASHIPRIGQSIDLNTLEFDDPLEAMIIGVQCYKDPEDAELIGVKIHNVNIILNLCQEITLLGEKRMLPFNCLPPKSDESLQVIISSLIDCGWKRRLDH